MRGTLNAHKAFKGTVVRPGYLDALDISDKRDQSLRNARDQIRQTLRQDLPQWEGLAKSHGLVERRHMALASQLPPLRPRFRMQGSRAYHTLNEPAHMPPQEVDFDDGMFLPTSFVNGNNRIEPLLAAKGYFKIVEATLAPLCKRNGWVLDRSKPTCVRIGLDGEAHIDLPLYAVPDEDFAQLTAAAGLTQVVRGVIGAGKDEIVLAEHVYRGLQEDQIMLARRDSGWIESDPRKIEDWVLDAVREHGKVLRRVCRYIKAWRDYQWKKGGPSSLALMACVVTIFDKLDGPPLDSRDDLATQAVADQLSGLFSQHIPNPVLPDQHLDESWSPEDRQNFMAGAADLKTALDRALNGTYLKAHAVSQLKSAFGARIPDDEHLLDIDSEEREVLAHEPAKVAAPFVPRTTSG